MVLLLRKHWRKMLVVVVVALVVSIAAVALAASGFPNCNPNEQGVVDVVACRQDFVDAHENVGWIPDADASDEDWEEAIDRWMENHPLSEDSECALRGDWPCVDVTETPSPSPTVIITPTATQTVTPTVTIEPSPTATQTVTPTVTIEPSPTATQTVTPTVTIEPSPTATQTITPTETVEPTVPAPTSTPIPTSEPRDYACTRVNFEVAGQEASRGAYVVQEVGGRVLLVVEMDNGWVDSGTWIEGIDISFDSVYVKVFFVKGDGSEPIELIILNPAPDTDLGWLSRGKCHALEVGWPNQPNPIR